MASCGGGGDDLGDITGHGGSTAGEDGALALGRHHRCVPPDRGERLGRRTLETVTRVRVWAALVPALWLFGSAGDRTPRMPEIPAPWWGVTVDSIEPLDEIEEAILGFSRTLTV